MTEDPRDEALKRLEQVLERILDDVRDLTAQIRTLQMQVANLSDRLGRLERQAPS
jgi:hypothetical protein